MTTITTAEMTTGSVLSKDGTRIGYLQVGQGPAAACLAPTVPTTASAPRSRTCRPSSPGLAPNGSSGSASAP
jgi:hypothetical protein